MISKDLLKIKKRYGEKMSHLCRVLFPNLLEKEGLLPKLLLEHFNPNHELYQDLLNSNLTVEFRNYIYSLLDIKDNKQIPVLKTPTELLDEAGYILYECKCEEDIQSFRKYYKKEEELCTFKERRLAKCYVFFAVKKDVSNIKREDYKEPKREDKYGTSVISIQFTRDMANMLSIKNRYNHTVSNPDVTFSNNLDNIIPGLTASFENTYGLKQKNNGNSLEIPQYVLASDGKYYKYNYEINNIYYCPDNILVDNFQVQKYAKEKYLVMDYFLLDLVNKKLILIDNKIQDSFVGSIGEIKKIQIKNIDKGKKVIISPVLGNDIMIALDNDNRIIELTNSNLEKVGDNFLYYNNKLSVLILPNLREVGNDFLTYNQNLVILELKKLRTIGNNFLVFNQNLKSLSLPNLLYVGDNFLVCSQNLINVALPKLKEVGNFFIFNNQKLTTLLLPELEIVGNYFLFANLSLRKLFLPSLKIVGEKFLFCNQNLRFFLAHLLQELKDDFFINNVYLRNDFLDKIKKVKIKV